MEWGKISEKEAKSRLDTVLVKQYMVFKEEGGLSAQSAFELVVQMGYKDAVEAYEADQSHRECYPDD